MEAALFFSFFLLVLRRTDPYRLLRVLSPGLFLSALSSFVLVAEILFGNDFVPGYLLQRIMLLCLILPIAVVYFSISGKEYICSVYLPLCTQLSSVLCGIGLCLWLAGTLHLIQPSFVLPVQWGGPQRYRSYFGLVCLTQLQIGMHGVWRFTSIFVEAPLAGFFILTMLAFELFLCSKTHWRRCVVFVIAAVCTFSTTTIVLLPILLAGYALTNPSIKYWFRHSAFQTYAKVLFVVAIAVCIPLWGHYAVSHKSNVASTTAHISQTAQGLNSFLDSPIVGKGIGNYTAAFADGGQTSGLLSTLAQGGLLLAIPYLLPIFTGFAHAIKSRNIQGLIFVVFISVEFAIVFIDSSCLFCIALALLYSWKLTSRTNDIYSSVRDICISSPIARTVASRDGNS
ncbi:MAG: hypothetical protein PUF51_01980 [Bifidobacteriaceae bacterium]|nr:hypothetical protein [Bifidobacteriaceae bacterium]